MHKLLPIINGNFLFITPILHPIFDILILLTHQALLAGLLKIIGSVDGYSIVLNLTQLFSIVLK